MLAVLPVSVFKKQKCFFVLFFRVVFFSWKSVSLVLFFIKMCVFFFFFFFVMMGKIIVNTAIYHNFVTVPNLFASLHLTD